ncbi:MAG TPA: DUF4388 domain-containing protein [Candidatus Acidoferrales bacterium]
MKTGVRILLVEDNPALLDLMRKGMEHLGEVTTANDGADAIRKVSEQQPDLVVADYRMPNVDGAALFEKLRNSEATRQIPLIFVASRKDIEERLQLMAGTVEDYIVKPFFLKDLVSRAKKVVDRIRLEKLQRGATRLGVIQGRLEEMNVIDLCQSLEMGQKSCRLTLRSGGKECSLFFQNGQILDASLDTSRGDDAFYQIVLWNEGEFEIDFSMAPSRQTTTRSTQGLLMEALRLVDEANRGAVQS